MKKLRKLSLLIAGAVIALTCVLSNLTFFAGAATETFAFEGLTVKDVPHEVVVGTEVTLPSDGNRFAAKVLDPMSKEVSVTDNKFTANLVGYYSVSYYGDNNFFYDGFKINVTAPKAQLSVAFKGADIPTYALPGATVDLPAASMVEYDDDGKIDKALTATANSEFTIKKYFVKGETRTEITTATYDLPSDSGTYFIRYVATKAGVSAFKLTKDFTVKVQSDFSDKEKPVLSVVNVPNEINQFTKVTLPIATATDNFDANVKITVTVKDANGEVVVVDDTDPKNLIKGTDKVEFDNDKVMSFYPTEPGKYTVTYTAWDDTKVNKTESVFSMVCADKKAPTLEIDETLIPSKWGKSVITVDGQAGTAKVLKFPKGSAYDNVDATATVNFSLRDPNGYTFYNTGATPAKTNAAVTADDDFYIFDITLFTPELTSGKTIGEYTATYTTKDSKSNSTSKSFVVNIQAEYKDIVDPEVEVTYLPDYILVGDKFTKPVISVYDEPKESKVNLKTVYTFAPTSGSPVTFDFETKSYHKFTEAGVITVAITATDGVGHVKTVNKTVNVLSTAAGAAGAKAPTISAGLSVADVTLTPGIDTAKVSAPVVITLAGKEDKYLGYEVIVREPATATFGGKTVKGVGKIISATVKSVFTYDGTDSVLTLEEITADVTKEGTHSLTVRAFDITGRSTIVSTTFEVGGTSEIPTPGAQTSVVSIPDELELGQAYSLPNVTAASGFDLVKVVKGTQYELRGSIITPKATGTYSIEYFNRDSSDANPDNWKYSKPTGGTFNVVDKVSPTISIYDEVPLYMPVLSSTNYATDKAANKTDEEIAHLYFVKIPDISVVDLGGGVTVDITVTDKDSSSTSDFVISSVDGAKYFRPEKDGKYTVSYKVTDRLGNTQSHSFTVSVGDLIQPTMTVTTTPTESVKKGATFSFSKVEATDEVSTSSYITITKKLVTPSGSTKTETGSSASTTKYDLDEVGTYTVIYEAKDAAGNTTVKEYKINVSEKATNPVNKKILSAVLIIVGILLVIFVILFFFRFRKVNKQTK